MSQLGKDIAEYLKEFHITEQYAVRGRELCLMFNIKGKQLRNIVSTLRQEGEPICSSSAGYWYSMNPEDIEKTLRRLEGQVKNMNISIEGLKKVLEVVDYGNIG